MVASMVASAAARAAAVRMAAPRVMVAARAGAATGVVIWAVVVARTAGRASGAEKVGTSEAATGTAGEGAEQLVATPGLVDRREGGSAGVGLREVGLPAWKGAGEPTAAMAVRPVVAVAKAVGTSAAAAWAALVVAQKVAA